MSENLQSDEIRQSPVSKAQKDDVYLVPGIVILFVIVSLKYIVPWEIDTTVIAVMLSTAVSMVVYRFLGGIEASTQFSLGAIKFGGSLAALAGLFLLLDDKLEFAPRDLGTVFPETVNTRWVAVDERTAEPVDLIYNLTGVEKILKRPEGVFDNNNLDILPTGKVVSSIGAKTPLGHLDQKDLESLMIEPTQSNPFGPVNVLSERIYENDKSKWIENTPFQLTITDMNAGVTSFYLTSADDPTFKWPKTFSGHTADVAVLNGVPYMVLIYAFSHPRNNSDSSWSRFSFCRMNLDTKIAFPSLADTP